MSNFLSLCAAEVTAVQESTGYDWSLIWSTVVTGIVVVFLILAILVFLLWLMGKIFSGVSKSGEKKKKAAAEAEAAVKAPEPEQQAEAAEEYYEEEDDGELIAVISAAIAAYGEAEGKQYKITSVRKRDKAARSAWSAAGIADNTRGF